MEEEFIPTKEKLDDIEEKINKIEEENTKTMIELTEKIANETFINNKLLGIIKEVREKRYGI